MGEKGRWRGLRFARGFLLFFPFGGSGLRSVFAILLFFVDFCWFLEFWEFRGCFISLPVVFDTSHVNKYGEGSLADSLFVVPEWYGCV